jgi:hypothetical protein
MCAAQIVRAIQRRRNEIAMTFQGKMLLQLNRWLPRLVDRVLARDFARAMDKPQA